MARIKFTALNCVDMGGGIVLNISVPPLYKNAIQGLLSGFKAGNEYDIKPHKEKRSLSANALAWVLCDDIAKVLHGTKEGIYRHAISHVGVFTEMQFSSPEAMERFKQIWQGNGIGWLTHSINDTTLHAYAGSSTYNSSEMHRLIEFLMDEAQALGIETKPQEEVDALLKSWGAEK